MDITHNIKNGKINSSLGTYITGTELGIVGIELNTQIWQRSHQHYEIGVKEELKTYD